MTDGNSQKSDSAPLSRQSAGCSPTTQICPPGKARHSSAASPFAPAIPVAFCGATDVGCSSIMLCSIWGHYNAFFGAVKTRATNRYKFVNNPIEKRGTVPGFLWKSMIQSEKCGKNCMKSKIMVDLARTLCYSTHYLSDERFSFCAPFFSDAQRGRPSTHREAMSAPCGPGK